MLLKNGEKIHVITRRTFAEDLRRHFAGEVMEVDDTVLRVEGYTFVYNGAKNAFLMRPELRTRLFSLVDAANIFNVLPLSVDVAKLNYRIIDGRLALTDDDTFSLDVNEFRTG